jgi:hypothetical protein
MYVVGSCGHTTTIGDTRAIEGDLGKVVRHWETLLCFSCQRTISVAEASALIPPEDELPRLKGQRKKNAAEIRRKYLTAVHLLQLDDKLPDLLKDDYDAQIGKIEIYAKKALRQTQSSWWNREFGLIQKIYANAPNVSVMPLIKDLTTKILLEELENQR